AEVERELRDGIAELARTEFGGAKLLESLTTFIGGGAPRFWSSVTPEARPQSNYAQILVRVTDKNVTPHIAGPLQQRISAAVPGAIVDVRQLQTNPVPYPIEVRISGRATIDSRAAEAEVRTL